MRRQFMLIVVVAVVMAVASALLGSYTWGTVAPGLSGRRAISGGAFHAAVTCAQAMLWWRFTEGADLPRSFWFAYAVIGGLARGGLRVWTVLESSSETAAEAILAAQVAARPMELLAYRCFYVFVLVWQVLVSASANTTVLVPGERRRKPAGPRTGRPGLGLEGSGATASPAAALSSATPSDTWHGAPGWLEQRGAFGCLHASRHAA